MRPLRASLLLAGVLVLASPGAAGAAKPPLWRAYDDSLARARYVDLTHTITPKIPVWAGFGPSTFSPTVNPATGQPYTYASDGFEATRYLLQTDQLGTQLDPPAHWAPEYAAIDELRPRSSVTRVPAEGRIVKSRSLESTISASRFPAGTIVSFGCMSNPIR